MGLSLSGPPSLPRNCPPAPLTQQPPFDGDITTADDFEAVLGQLPSAASAHAVDLEGSWEYRSDGSDADLEVVIVELEKRAGDD